MRKNQSHELNTKALEKARDCSDNMMGGVFEMQIKYADRVDSIKPSAIGNF